MDMNSVVFVFLSQCLTLQRVSGQAELADNVAWDVRLHQVSLFGVIFSCLQEVVKVLWVKLLQQNGTHFIAPRRALFVYAHYDINL